MLLILTFFGVIQSMLLIAAVIILHKEIKKLRYELENHSHYNCLEE